MSYNNEILNSVGALKEVFWKNSELKSFKEVKDELGITYEYIIEAEARLKRFAPLIKELFPETVDGFIESELVECSSLKSKLEENYNVNLNGRMFLKCDNDLEVAGSIKARGGIYEVLKHAEDIAFEKGMLKESDNYSIMKDAKFRELFSKYKIAVGSTGNLGLSIGIMSAALGFQVFVHMSSDAKEWKKNLLRQKGVNVIEYNDDYGKAVEEGRKQSQNDDKMYFIDDENSKDLFLGYSTAALRLEKQLEERNIKVNSNNKLHVYLPCGVGGAPGGITFGLKQLFGDNVKCYFVEPVNAPCMLLALASKQFDKVSVKEYGIELKTEADGLAVGRASALVCKIINNLIEGIYTIKDRELYKLLTLCKDEENIKIEPSAASSIKGPFINENIEHNGIHVCWLTGGMLMPHDIYEAMYKRGKEELKF